MPKALCLISLGASALILLAFASDLVMTFAGMQDSALMGGASMMMDIGFIVFAIILIVLSFTTYREQR